VSETLELPETPPLDSPPPVDEPPKRGHGGKPTTRAGRAQQAAANRAAKADAKPKVTPPKKGNVAESVNGLHQLAGGLALPLVGLPATGQALVQAGPDAGKAWAALAQRYPAVEKLFTTGGDGVLFVTLLMAYLPVVTVAMQESSVPKDQRAGAMNIGDLGAMFGMVPAQAGAPVAEAA